MKEEGELGVEHKLRHASRKGVGVIRQQQLYSSFMQTVVNLNLSLDSCYELPLGRFYFHIKKFRARDKI